MTTASIKRYEGVSIVASDLADSLHFWVDFVGGDLVMRGTSDGALPWRVSIGGSLVEIYQANERQAPSPGSTNQHYCWDIEPTEFDWWVQHGLTWNMRPKSISAHHNGKELSLYWDDPDGYHFEVAAHYCTDHELRKARESRMEAFRKLMALPQDRFTRASGPRPSLVS